MLIKYRYFMVPKFPISIIINLGVLMSSLKKLAANSRGATAIEYAIIAAVISAVAIVGFGTIGENVSTRVTETVDSTTP